MMQTFQCSRKYEYWCRFSRSGSVLPMSRRWLFLPIALIALLLLLGAEPVAKFAPNVPFSASPVFQRIDLSPTDHVQRTLTIQAAQDLTVLAIESPCRCVAVTTPFPLPMKAGTSAKLTLSVSGALPGLKTLTLRTTAGSLPIQVQVVSAGLGDGLTGWKAIAARAVAQKLSLVVIVHDLQGEIRNCSCSGGSLGGIDHLAALPTAVAVWAPGVSTRFVLTGDVDGHRNGVERALSACGWKRDASVIVSTNPERDVQDAALLAVIPSVHTAINHRKLITPVLTGGMTAEALLIDSSGQIVEHETLPIDRSLPADPTILAQFPDTLSSRVDETRVPSQDCTSCHTSAHATWLTTKHALALNSLTPENRTDACITCHSTPIAAPSPTVAPGVHCQSCHAGADAHAAAPATVRTSGKTDCRSCHDARHDPGFDPVKAWATVGHGK